MNGNIIVDSPPNTVRYSPSPINAPTDIIGFIPIKKVNKPKAIDDVLIVLIDFSVFFFPAKNTISALVIPNNNVNIPSPDIPATEPNGVDAHGRNADTIISTELINKYLFNFVIIYIFYLLYLNCL